MSIKLEVAFFVFIALVLLAQVFWIFKTENRLKRFFSGKKGRDLENAIEELEGKIKELTLAKEKGEKEIANLKEKLKKSIRGLETLRFNPFADQGGNQSFAVGMVNEEGDGVVFSSLYARERMSVFAKPIKGGKSDYELSKEEKEAVWQAQQKIK